MEPQDLEMPDFNDYTPEVRALIVLLGQAITETNNKAILACPACQGTLQFPRKRNSKGIPLKG